MSSKKYRKGVRRKVIMWLHQVRAARMFFNKESDDMYNKELSEINSNMSADEIWARTWMVNSRYFGCAYMNWVSWAFGGIKLSFNLPDRNGKIKAQDLIVKRVQENDLQ